MIRMIGMMGCFLWFGQGIARMVLSTVSTSHWDQNSPNSSTGFVVHGVIGWHRFSGSLQTRSSDSL